MQKFPMRVLELMKINRLVEDSEIKYGKRKQHFSD